MKSVKNYQESFLQYITKFIVRKTKLVVKQHENTLFASKRLSEIFPFTMKRTRKIFRENTHICNHSQRKPYLHFTTHVYNIMQSDYSLFYKESKLQYLRCTLGTEKFYHLIHLLKYTYTHLFYIKFAGKKVSG